jgi:hypothetical protein
MTMQVDLNGIECLKGSSAILPTQGTKVAIVVVPTPAQADGSKESCNDGLEYDRKAITFINGKAVSVKCIMEGDLARLRVYIKGIRGTLEILDEVPEALAGPISCPPPMLNAEETVEKLDSITRWMHEKTTSTARATTDDGQPEDADDDQPANPDVQKAG